MSRMMDLTFLAVNYNIVNNIKLYVYGMCIIYIIWDLGDQQESPAAE